MVKYIQDENGFISNLLLTYGAIFSLITLILLSGIAISLNVKGQETYNWFQSAMDYSAYMANIDGDTSKVVARELYAKEYFIDSFSKMTNCKKSGNLFIPTEDNYPGPIRLTEFTAVTPGEDVLHSTAQTPGYQAVIQVPLFGGHIPLVGNRYISVPMKYYTVIRKKAE